jgi:hypothetical protein
MRGAEQDAAEPPFDPAQLQFQGLLPLGAEAEPVVQSPLVGALPTAMPFAEPHTPFTAEEARESEHIAVAPPLLPAQLQLHGPLPATVDAVPALQRLAIGAVLTFVPFALPHAPLMSSRAEQLAIEEPHAPLTKVATVACCAIAGRVIMPATGFTVPRTG